jgi:hypothetical protein
MAIPTKRGDRRIVSYLTKEEINSILETPDQSVWLGRRDHALILTLYNTGARVSELITLQQSQLHVGVHTFLQLHVKGRKERVVPVWPKASQILRSWFREIGEEPNRLAFPNAHGGPLTRQGVNYILSQTAQKAQSTCPSLKGKRISPHVFRHTTAMHLLQAGVDTETIALWLRDTKTFKQHTFMWRLILLPREKLSISLRRPAHSPYGTKRLMPSWHFLTLFKRNPNDSSPSSASSSHSSRPRKIVRVRSLNRSSYYGKSNQCICWIRTRVPISLHIILHFT